MNNLEKKLLIEDLISQKETEQYNKKIQNMDLNELKKELEIVSEKD